MNTAINLDIPSKLAGWVLHGKPPDWKPHESGGYATTRDGQPTPETTLFSKEQILLFQKMFAQQQTQPVQSCPPSPNKSSPTLGATVVAQTSNNPTSLGI